MRSAFIVIWKKNNVLNCWKPLKPHEPQRKYEIKLSVMVTKVERIMWMA
nr:MAG TPA: hypothetical protein [Caudoviricetes sp.]